MNNENETTNTAGPRTTESDASGAEMIGNPGLARILDPLGVRDPNPSAPREENVPRTGAARSELDARLPLEGAEVAGGVIVRDVVVAKPSICRAVVVFRMALVDEEITRSAPVPATVQSADGLTIDCYAVGELDIDGSGGARGGLHELRSVKHMSLATEDGLFWDWPPRG